MPDAPNDAFCDFYEKFYTAIAGSKANAEYNERLFGKDMDQQGFAEVSHLDHLIEVSGGDRPHQPRARPGLR